VVVPVLLAVAVLTAFGREARGVEFGRRPAEVAEGSG
jgi:hypothetical protein